MIETENWDQYTVLKSVIKYDKLGLSKKMVERKLAKAYLKFYTRPKYLFDHKYMFKVIMGIVLRSFIIPKIKGTTGKGWYQTLDNTHQNKQ